MKSIRISNSFTEGEIETLEQIMKGLIAGRNLADLQSDPELESLDRKFKSMKASAEKRREEREAGR